MEQLNRREALKLATATVAVALVGSDKRAPEQTTVHTVPVNGQPLPEQFDPPACGCFRLECGELATAWIPYDATPEQVRNALTDAGFKDVSVCVNGQWFTT